ncbi:MAG: peptidylprolyl isomerase [Burkholderiaceae bacterium]
MFIAKSCRAALAALAALLAFVTAPAWSQSAVQPVDRVIAVVNDEVITARELDSRVAAVRSSQPAGALAGVAPEVVRQRVLEQMVIERAQEQRARELGIKVSEAQIDRGVESIAANNRISIAQLRSRLRADGVSMDSFREQVRAQIAQVRLRELEVESRIQISDADVDAFLANPANRKQEAPEVRVAQIFLRLPENPDQTQLEARRGELRALADRARAGEPFEALARQYSESEEASGGGSFGWRPLDRLPGLFVSAIEPLAAGELSDIVVSPAGLHLLKLQERRGGAADDKPVTQTRVRHILMRPDASGNNETEIERTLERVRSRLVDGSASFEAMARQYSVDGSASRGGELGWVGPGDTVPEFERAMSGLDAGQISGIVRSPFGLHLIQVIERRQSGSGRERARQSAKMALRQQRADEAWAEWLAQLRDETYVEYRLEP